jgi:hypothetical protein
LFSDIGVYIERKAFSIRTGIFVDKLTNWRFDELLLVNELIVDDELVLIVVDDLVVAELPLLVERVNVLVITVLNKHGTIVLTEK